MKALIIGGTGATGLPILNELVNRGYEVTIYHRGAHEVGEMPPDIEHIHGDPHFEETLQRDLKGRTFEVTVATYGRMRYIIDMLKGRTQRLLTVGAMPVLKGWWHPHDLHNVEHRGPVPVLGTEDLPKEDKGIDPFVDRMLEAEEALMKAHAEGHYVVTHFRCSNIYGPRSAVPRQWTIMRRIQDGRKQFILSDGGHHILGRIFSENVARAMGLAIDKPKIAGGQVYHLRDEAVFTVRQWVELIAKLMNYEFEFVEVPFSLAPPGYSYYPQVSQERYHRVFSNAKIMVQLGYRDKIPAQEAWARTVEWTLEHPLVRGSQEEKRATQDNFDYEAEDRLIAAWKKIEALARPIIQQKVIAERRVIRHPYSHPKHPGDLSVGGLVGTEPQ